VSSARDVPRPGDVTTSDQFALAMQALRGSLSYSALDKAAKNAGYNGGLPRSTVSDLLRLGKTSETTLVAFLAACAVRREEHAAWLSAWKRTQGTFGSLTAAADNDCIEAAPGDELINDWLERLERTCLASVGSGQPSMADLMRTVTGGFGMIADIARVVHQMPEDPRGKTDPAVFARFGADMLGLFVDRVRQLPQATSRAPVADQSEEDYRAEVARYLEDCDSVLRERARHFVARWPGCSLRLRLSNPAEVDVLGIVVQLSFPEQVDLIEPELTDAAPPALPPSPVRRTGTLARGLTLPDIFNQDFAAVRRLAEGYARQRQDLGYTILDAGARIVQITGIDLPAKSATLLPRIPLLINGPASHLVVRWTATGNGSHQRFSGTLSLPVTASTLPPSALVPEN
jgi:hypothetical protein